MEHEDKANGDTDIVSKGQAMNSVNTEFASGSLAPPAPRGGRIAMVVGAIVVVGLVGLVGVRVKQSLDKKAQVAADRASAQAAAAAKPPVAVVTPKAMMWKPTIDVTGTLQPWRSADVGFEQAGRLSRVLVATGDHVKDGQSLAFLDSSIASAQVSGAEASARAAEANLALAQDNLKRTEALIATKSVPEAQAEQVRQQVALARAQLEGAHAQERLARTGAGQRSIVAPFGGLVTRAPTAAGGVVMPGSPLVRIEDHTRFRLSLTVGEQDADVVKPGASVAVRLRDRAVTGRVTAVVRSLDQATRRAPVEVEVNNDPKEPLLAWSFVHASIEGGRDVPALEVPDAVRRPGTQDELFVLRDGRAKALHVEHGVSATGGWVVREGLAATDLVVLAPDLDLKDGDPIDKTVQK
jgi:RND family efflux transporter MFP subunit